MIVLRRCDAAGEEQQQRCEKDQALDDGRRQAVGENMQYIAGIFEQHIH